VLHCAIVSDFRTARQCARFSACNVREETTLVHSINLDRVAIFAVFVFVTAIVLGAF
jgi:hypothetical protein